MSNYIIAVGWSGKDALADTDPGKVISGAEFNTEFTAVRTALNSKADANGSASENFTVNGLTATTGTIGGEEIVTLATPQTFTKAHPTASETITLASTLAVVTIPVTIKPSSDTDTVPRPVLALILLTLISDIWVHCPPLVSSYLYEIV